MTAAELIKILKQFDPERRVLLECGVHIFEPTVLILVPDPYPVNFTTPAEYGDILIAVKT